MWMVQDVLRGGRLEGCHRVLHACCMHLICLV